MKYITSEELSKKINTEGLIIIDVDHTYISAEVKLGKNVTIYPNCFIEGDSVIGDNCMIGANSKILNAIIHEGVSIESSWIINSEVQANTTIGPMAHIREHCVIGANCRIGNFVEMKKTLFGNGSKCAHLTYLGDCVVGEKVNIGCGVVTVNYDGKHKSQTVIGNSAFIGSNVNLIAPINIGDFAVVAAGSTCNKDVEADAMAIARAQQINKEGYGKKYLNK